MSIVLVIRCHVRFAGFRRQGAIGAIGLGCVELEHHLEFMEHPAAEAILTVNDYNLVRRRVVDSVLPAALGRQVGMINAGVYNNFDITTMTSTSLLVLRVMSTLVGRHEPLRAILPRHFRAISDARSCFTVHIPIRIVCSPSLWLCHADWVPGRWLRSDLVCPNLGLQFLHGARGRTAAGRVLLDGLQVVARGRRARHARHPDLRLVRGPRRRRRRRPGRPYGSRHAVPLEPSSFCSRWTLSLFWHRFFELETCSAHHGPSHPP